MLDDYPQARPVADHAMEIILNIALDNRENIDIEHEVSAFPVTMAVDYVKYYRRVPCLGVVTVNSPEGVLSTFGEYNFLNGTEVTLDTGFDLADGQQLEIVATDFVDINPAVTNDSGSYFIARIGASNCGPPSGLMLSDESTAPEEAQKAALVDSTILANEGRSAHWRASPLAGTALLAENAEVVVPAYCQNGAARIELVSCLGQRVLSLRAESILGAIRVPVLGLAPGTYILQVQCSGENSTFRVVVP